MEGERTMWTAYGIVPRGDDKPFFLQIGIAFLNRDHSINVLLDALPKDGKVHLRLKNGEGKRENGKVK